MYNMKGTVDIHVHAGPSISNRSVDTGDMIVKAKDFGYDAFVTKDHYFPSMMGTDMITKFMGEDKCKAFGCNVITIDGHDFDQIEQAFAFFHQGQGSGKPTCILMNTVKGKGVSFMENQAGWHGKAPNDEEYKIAMDELTAAMAELEAAK